MTSPSPLDALGPIDRDALDSLRPGLELIALRACGDRAVAEEIAQESIARALAAATRGTQVRLGGTAAFVAGIARHIIVDRRRAISRETHLSAAETVPTNDPDPLERMLAEHEVMRVRAALAELAPSDRELLRLSYFEGRTPAEIAVQVGEPSERIRKRKSRALERIRELLSDLERHVRPANPTNRMQAKPVTPDEAP